MVCSVMINCYFLYSYLTLSNDFKDNTKSRFFLIGVLSSWLMTIKYISDVRLMNKFWGMKLHRELWDRIHPSKWIYFSIIFRCIYYVNGMVFIDGLIPFNTSNCTEFTDSIHSCISSYIMTINSMFVFTLFAIGLIVLILFDCGVILIISDYNRRHGIDEYAMNTKNRLKPTDAILDDIFKGWFQKFLRKLFFIPKPEQPKLIECAICYDTIQSDTECKSGDCSCSYKYHSKCIDIWITESDNCPQCKSWIETLTELVVLSD